MFKRILVPLDGTPQSNAALPLARAMARPTGATITLLRVLPADGGATADVNHTLERVASALAEDGVQVNSVVRFGAWHCCRAGASDRGVA